jgi:hypothetical protein
VKSFENSFKDGRASKNGGRRINIGWRILQPFVLAIPDLFVPTCLLGEGYKEGRVQRWELI